MENLAGLEDQNNGGWIAFCWLKLFRLDIMAAEPIAHKAEDRMDYWLRAHSESRRIIIIVK